MKPLQTIFGEINDDNKEQVMEQLRLLLRFMGSKVDYKDNDK